MNVAKARGMCKTDGWDVLAVGTGLGWADSDYSSSIIAFGLWGLFLGLFF
jgi:hypothetical protein